MQNKPKQRLETVYLTDPYPVEYTVDVYLYGGPTELVVADAEVNPEFEEIPCAPP